MSLSNMKSPCDFRTHLQAACHARQRLETILRDGGVEVDGASLDISAIVAVAYYGCIPRITTDPAVLERIEASVQVLRDHLDKGYHIYGVNTGFGGSADSRTDRVVALQSGLSQLLQAGVLVISDKDDILKGHGRLDSHAVPVPWVRAAMLVRCNSNARGHSAVTLSVMESILQLLENRITPVVPLRGSISASGDLIPLSYIAGAIEGNPDVYVHVQKLNKPEIMPSRDALLSTGMQPQVLGPKEGLGLVNGTSFSTALSSLVMYETHQLTVLVQAISAVALEALMGNAESFHPFISAIRPHDGQMECARNILSFLQGSQLAQGIQNEKTHTRQGLMQDRYALRCVPQWIGPQLEDLLLAHKQVTVELNSTTDNPLIDPDSRDILHGGNFQAVSVTSAMEKTRTCLQMFGRLLFSQSTDLVDPSLNNGLPTNLVADDPSLSFTMKGVDISMASYMAELAYLANPVSSHVQAAEMRNQSINSMAFVSSRYTMQAVEIVSLMCACSLYIGCQALDLRVLHLTYLDNIKPQLHLLTSDLFSTYLSSSEFPNLTESIWESISKSWSTTTRLSILDRVQAAVKNTIPTLLDTLKEKQGPGLSDLTQWEIRAETILSKTYQDTAGAFFKHQNTEEFLGAGAKILYRTVRRGLNIPFHLGFVEHPTADNDTLNGRSKKTIGSWISIIYEAIRDGRLMGPFMESLLSKTSSDEDISTRTRGLRMSRL
ncbi:hypothetical protein ETB97_002633 [Aspergillus alliaceus]|uniref:L-Aspartase-like protein n=1 Tax=Petromyces alliaceus TaxID=209559 RepID=A0A8H6E4Z7_PETAA|nr:hypothetical protein ETB97_002633 [Aspergillus burnettii]